MQYITIFHTNDFHNKLTPEKAARLRQLKDSAPSSLLLDAGDAIWAGNIYFRPSGEPILKLMNDAGYDAMALGNREFHFLATGLKRKIGWAKFPVLCANIRPTNDAELTVSSDITFDVGGARVVVFGLTVPMITGRMLSRKVSSYVFDDPIETASAIVPELRQRADLLIALTHIGLAKDRELADKVSGIDLIVGGHTHASLDRPELIGKTTIVQAGWFARQIGKVEIDQNGKVSSELLAL